MRRFAPSVVSLTLLVCFPTAASAQQSFEVVGARALGMGGAFVAVADDATAVYWNPAGLAKGGPAGGTIDWGRFQFGNRDIPPIPGPSEGSSGLTSFGSWPVGLSLARFSSTVLVPDQFGVAEAFNTRATHMGVTVLQTLLENVVGGATVKYVRGRVQRAVVGGTTVEEALDRGSDLEGELRHDFDMDVGLLMDLQQLRFGVTWRNLFEPTLGTIAGNEIKLKRRARLGLAFVSAAGVILAMDFDLDTADLEGGPSQNLAFGGEARLGSKLSVRSGVRWSVKGDKRLVTSAGTSFAIRPRMWIDTYYEYSGNDEHRGYGFALRAGM
ncbi:MAG TPA: conjugal transfer protein TraF [Vicinamibacterales bacterium]